MANNLSIVKVIAKAGTTYAVEEGGATDIRLSYQVQLSRPLDQGELLPNGSITSFTDGTTTIPAIGTVHPDRPGYYVSKYDVRQPTGAAKATLDVTVIYSARSYTTSGGGQTPVTVESTIEQWGWDDGTSQRDLVTAADSNHTPVLNSAKDPFDSVPQVETPAPTFTKVVRFKTRKTGWFGYNCKVNQAAVSIGGVSCAAGTLLCTVAESIEPSNESWPYKYTVRLRYRTNKAEIGTAGSGSWTECGWDVVVTDAGMRELDSNGNLKLIQVLSAETGQPATVTSPELLNGSGSAVQRGSGLNPSPFNLRFQAYERASFPDWFVSEPTIVHNNS